MNQRYSMKLDKVKGVLTDISTEELAHVEIISAIVYQLTQGLTPEQIKEAGFDTYFVDHTLGVYPQSAAGAPFTAAYFQSKGDPITDLTEDLAAEQKARTTYDNILRLCDDPDVRDPSSSCGSGKSSTSSASARHSVRCRKIWIRKTSTAAIPPTTAAAEEPQTGCEKCGNKCRRTKHRP